LRRSTLDFCLGGQRSWRAAQRAKRTEVSPTPGLGCACCTMYKKEPHGKLHKVPLKKRESAFSWPWLRLLYSVPKRTTRKTALGKVTKEKRMSLLRQEKVGLGTLPCQRRTFAAQLPPATTRERIFIELMTSDRNLKASREGSNKPQPRRPLRARQVRPLRNCVLSADPCLVC